MQKIVFKQRNCTTNPGFRTKPSHLYGTLRHKSLQKNNGKSSNCNLGIIC